MKILYLTYERGAEIEKDHTVLYYDNKNKRSIEEIQAFAPDLVLEREYNDGEAIYSHLISILKTTLLKQPTYAVWLIDTHVSEARHREYAKLFDVVFLAVSRFIEPFKVALGHNNVFWMPLCYPYHTDSIRPNYNPVKYPVSFVGRWNAQWFPERTAYIGKLGNKYGNQFTAVTDYDNMMSIMRKSKVAFNCAISTDMNFRVFESLGAGAELVTNDVEDLHKIKGLAERINIYTDDESLYKAIDGVLANDPAYTHNTKDNEEYIKQHHTLYKRHQAMLDIIQYRQPLEF